MTVFNKFHPFVLAMKGWDRIRNTEECPHCNRTGRGPSADGRTECGFCDKSIPKEGS